MYIEQVIENLEYTNNKIKELSDKIAPFQEELNGFIKLRNQLHDAVSEYKADRIKELPDEEKLPIYLEIHDGMAMYKDTQKFFENMGVSTAGGNPDTNQYYIQIAMHEDKSNIEQVATALWKITPFIRAVDGWKRFDILEHTLCLHSSYYAVYDERLETWLLHTHTTFKHKQMPLYANENLQEFLAYICSRYYYISIEEDYSCSQL